MDSLLPLIITVVLTAVLSAMTKKKKVTPNNPTPSDSPWKGMFKGDVWDEIVKELGIPEDEINNEDKRKRVQETNSDAVDDSQYSSEYIPATEYEMSEYHPETFEYKYEFENGADYAVPAMEITSDIATNELAAKPIIANAIDSSKSKDNEVVVKTTFSDGFDLRMAVLYSEVMKPKFQEY